MRRRQFICGLGGAAVLAFAAPVRGAEAPRRVGVLIFGAENDPVAQTRANALRDGLKMLDWVEGRTIQLDFRFGDADPRRVQARARELVALAPDVIVTGAAPATEAVRQLTQTIPIVFVEVTNATAFGANNLTRTDANATGITNLYLAIGARWVEFLKQAAPRIRRVALLFNPDFNSRGYLNAIEAVAATYEVKTTRAPVRNAEEIRRAVGAFAGEPQGGLLMVPPTPAFSDVQLIFRLANQYRLPAIYPTRGFAAEGGMMAYGANSAELFRNAASYVDKILHGAKPGDLTVSFPTKFELALNLKAARAIGVEMPASLLASASEVIP